MNDLTGNNSNSPAQAKNIETPWKTVQFAIDNAAVLTGDNIVVAAGIYSGFNLTKRLNIIGAWKGGMLSVSTIFNSTLTLSSPGGSFSERMVIKNLRVLSAAGDAVDIRSGFVTLENVYASAPLLNSSGVIFNSPDISDVIMESCNFNSSNKAGIFFTSSSGVDGFTLRNSTINNNGYFGIAAFQSPTFPNEIKNVDISHCTFIDNNSSNRNKGHTIYFEKLKNATFQNISVVMPAGNNWMGILLNMAGREDFSNVNFFNSRIIRATPGRGMYIQTRNFLSFPQAKLENVVLRGNTFTNCDTNIIFAGQVRNITVDKCDLSNYSAYGLINLTIPGEIINASNNKWKNGDIPDTTVISAGTLTSGSSVISDMPSTDGIFVGMGVIGGGINPGSTVISKTSSTITMSQNAVASGSANSIVFVFNFAASTDILRTTVNEVICSNPLANALVNQANISYPDIASALAGTNPGGTIWNLPNALIPGTTSIVKDITLIGPGAGFLHSGSLTTFQNLNVSSNFIMGSDFAVAENYTPGFTFISTDNTLIINGTIVSGGHLTGGLRSDMFFGGTGPNISLRAVTGGLRTLQISRANGVTISADLLISRTLFLQTGNLTLASKNLLLDKNASIFNPFPAASYVNTSGTGYMKKFFDNSTPTSFNYTVGAGNYSPVRVCFTDPITANKANFNVRAVNSKHPQNQCNTDYLNRYWSVVQLGLNGVNADLVFGYNTADVVGAEASIYGARFNGINWTTYTPVNTATHSFSVNGTSSFGDFTGGGLDCISNFMTLINAKIFLEGAYTGLNTMRINLLTNGFIPLKQPYNTAPFNYDGTETVTSIPADVVDWVYLELRSTPAGAPLANGQRAAFIKSDGSIVDLDGVSPVKTDVIGGNYYIVIGHRNHLPVMSQSAQRLDSVSAVYDFSTGLIKYFGGAAADLGNDQFGMYAGDANKSFIITAADYTLVTDNLFVSDYNQADINMTGIVTAADYTLITKNIFVSSNVPNYP
ncbi:MAG: right-handed parallel beta-helix repeat-containing protein [Ignavibacteria bacterium]|nr:right-handed parallel beta-helix repeat-containing protein [Ignavibacteria bacterium]